jgi:hypothetical protein
VDFCAELSGELGFLLAQRLQAGAVATDPFLAELGGESAVFEGFEVTLQFRFESADVGAG